MTKTTVAVIMGSDSDLEVMRRCIEQLKALGITPRVRVLSAHRTPRAVEEFTAAAPGEGIKVIIAGAGMSAALAGTIAARTSLPVIGVAMVSPPLGGIDALLSTVQMPPGVPVACLGLGAAGATNAAIFAAEILALSDPLLAERLAQFKSEQTRKVLARDEKARQEFGG